VTIQIEKDVVNGRVSLIIDQHREISLESWSTTAGFGIPKNETMTIQFRAGSWETLVKLVLDCETGGKPR